MTIQCALVLALWPVCASAQGTIPTLQLHLNATASLSSTETSAASASSASGLRLEIKGALIGLGVGAASGLILNRILNDGTRDAGSYAKAMSILGATGAMFGYVAGAKLKASPQLRGLAFAAILLPHTVAIGGSFQRRVLK
jgi:hypothetical protein